MNFYRRLKTPSRKKARCSKCTATACRFADVGLVRVWYCKECFKKENDDNGTGSLRRSYEHF
jgi:hypothetical protein